VKHGQVAPAAEQVCPRYRNHWYVIHVLP